MKITNCHITAQPKDFTDPMPKVIVTFEDGTQKELFEFYPDEIMFLEHEFIGLTETQASDLKWKKDIAYLNNNVF